MMILFEYVYALGFSVKPYSRPYTFPLLYHAHCDAVHSLLFPCTLCWNLKADLAKFRRAELKHGRVAMLAVVGVVWQEFSVLPGLGYAPTKNLFQAVADTPWLALVQLIAFIGIFDLQSTKYDMEKGRVPGDIGFDPLKLSKDGINEKYALSELKHGRLAMWAMAAILVQQLLVPDKSPLELAYEWSSQFN